MPSPRSPSHATGLPALVAVLGLCAPSAPGCAHDWNTSDGSAEHGVPDEASGESEVDAGDEGLLEDGTVDADDGGSVTTDDAGPSCGNGRRDPGEECDTALPRRCTTDCDSIGGEPCIDCFWSAECVPPAEWCNRRDDDCDGEIDESFDCREGDERGCDTTCGSRGLQGCGPECAWDPICAPPAELCNGRDDDCDGVADEDFECVREQPAECVNACWTVGWRSCNAACFAYGECCATEETCSCDGRRCDDDCDGLTDEGCPAC